MNGGERIPAQTTILMNDLLTYKEEIAGYGMVDTVIVFEVPESIKDSIESVNLILVGSDGENTYTIK